MHTLNINAALPHVSFQPGATQKTEQTRQTLPVSNTGEGPVRLEVSDEGRKAFEGQIAEFLSHEAVTQRKAELAKKLADPKEIDPFENEFQIMGVTYTFMEGSLEDLITDELGGKLKNASLVASELGKMIRSSFINPDATVEERAIDRETALNHVRYLAKNYFDEPDKAKAFLDKVQRFADNDVLREKGYIVFDNSDMQPYKSYMSSVKDSGSVSTSAYARLYQDSSVLEKDSDPQKAGAFFNSLQSNNVNVLGIMNSGGFNSFIEAIGKNKAEWDAILSGNFAKNEKYVSDIISNVKSTLDEDYVAKSLARFMNAF
jgi:hypothetical protein